MTDIWLDVVPDDLDLKTRYANLIGQLDLFALDVAEHAHGWFEISIHLPDATLTARPRSRFGGRHPAKDAA